MPPSATGKPVMYNRLLQPDLRMMLAENDTLGLHEFCDALHPAVVAEVLEGMPPAQVWRVLSATTLDKQGEVFAFIDADEQLDLVENLDRKHLSQLIEVMASDDRVDLLSRMDAKHVDALLPLIAQAERDEIKELLSYPENSAGSLMTTEYATIAENLTVREALERLQQQAPDSETIYYVYIVTEQRRLLGVVTLRELILAKPHVLITEMIRRGVASVHVDDDQEFVAKQFALYDLIALPVVDAEDRLVGIITHDDILDVVQEEADEDAYRQAAIEPFEQDYLSTPVLTMAWKRGVWLLVLSAVALGTAKILSEFGWMSSRYIWLGWFQPLVLASGGNTGSQSATLVIRALAISTMSRLEKRRIFTHELQTGLTLGSALAGFAFVSSHWLFQLGLQEACVVGMTICLVVTLGSVAGSLLPLLFDRIGMDPALMSNPLISSLSDIFAVLIYYSVAFGMLELLSGGTVSGAT